MNELLNKACEEITPIECTGTNIEKCESNLVGYDSHENSITFHLSIELDLDTVLSYQDSTRLTHQPLKFINYRVGKQ